MRALIWLTAGTCASLACGFGGLGLAVYAQGDATQQLSAAGLYAAFGLGAGLVCSALELAWRRLPASAQLGAIGFDGTAGTAGAAGSAP